MQMDRSKRREPLQRLGIVALLMALLVFGGVRLPAQEDAAAGMLEELHLMVGRSLVRLRALPTEVGSRCRWTSGLRRPASEVGADAATEAATPATYLAMKGRIFSLTTSGPPRDTA